LPSPAVKSPMRARRAHDYQRPVPAPLL
jgi:hypothetical protein